jgi:hypothetical protein
MIKPKSAPPSAALTTIPDYQRFGADREETGARVFFGGALGATLMLACRRMMAKSPTGAAVKKRPVDAARSAKRAFPA